MCTLTGGFVGNERTVQFTCKAGSSRDVKNLWRMMVQRHIEIYEYRPAKCLG